MKKGQEEFLAEVKQFTDVFNLRDEIGINGGGPLLNLPLPPNKLHCLNGPTCPNP